MKAYSLGMENLTVPGNGDFGHDTLAFENTQAQRNLTINSALVAGINYTYYYNGFIGIGTTPGIYDEGEMKPLINQLVEDMQAIPSHSYGYTAGASYSKPTARWHVCFYGTNGVCHSGKANRRRWDAGLVDTGWLRRQALSPS